jgi:hypothetical protein
MNRGFISLAVIAIIGLVTVLTTGSGYAIYKYNEVSEEKADVEAQKNHELEELREQVKDLEGEEETGLEAIKVEKTYSDYYIKPETANIRPCTDTTSSKCDPLGQYTQNTELNLPFSSIDEMPGWVVVDWNGKDAFINKVVLSANEVTPKSSPTSYTEKIDTVYSPPVQEFIPLDVENNIESEPESENNISVYDWDSMSLQKYQNSKSTWVRYRRDQEDVLENWSSERAALVAISEYTIGNALFQRMEIELYDYLKELEDVTDEIIHATQDVIDSISSQKTGIEEKNAYIYDQASSEYSEAFDRYEELIGQKNTIYAKYEQLRDDYLDAYRKTY